MDRKFIPENTSNVEFHEPDYLRSKVLICLAIVAAVVPVVGLSKKNFLLFVKNFGKNIFGVRVFA